MKHNISYIAIAFAILAGMPVCAQDKQTGSDSIAAELKMKSLQAHRDRLQTEIKIQDAKRNRQIAGVSPETLEEMNDLQDSLCLALRSQLMDVNLEIKEASSSVSSSALLQQFNNLVNKQAQTPADSSSTTVQQPVKIPAGKPKK